MGIRLKMAKRRFAITKQRSKCSRYENAGIIGDLKIMEEVIASPIFENGPAKATFIMSFLGLLKLYGFIGTGFAHPGTGIWLINANKGINIEPIGSRWGMGFKVSLPKFLAVGSPHLSAIRPWKTSWTTTENIKTQI